MSSVDWQKIKAEYLQGSTSYRKLADKHGVSFSTLEKRARAENWVEQRKNVSEEAAAKARQKIVSRRTEDIELLDKSRTLLIQKLHRSIEKFQNISGNRMEQTSTEIIAADAGSCDGNPKKQLPKQKIVRLESDLLKMVLALDKLMEMTGYDTAGQAEDVPVLLDLRPEDK